MTLALWIALGSALGGSARFMLADLSMRMGPQAFPWDTLAVNTLGSLLIGVVAALSATGGRFVVSSRWRQFWMTGVCGGFTTFSIFSVQSLALLQTNLWLGLLNLLATATLCLLAVWVGWHWGSRLDRTTTEVNG
ncbi:CrcB family protein [Marinimicrobium alkaliphilum]|uniref:CrcB family protein n=1 Tax=Marinimicrobium alkaliphilum TaxID=2202654 RepID=UPI000DBA670B|nr:CrcB family protein [Marinimicrobium alkaliphilum]